MNYLLVTFLFMILLFSYGGSNSILISPHFIITGVFLLSATVVAINTGYWNYSISLKTTLLITAALVSFGVGQFFGTRISIRRRSLVDKCNDADNCIGIPELTNGYILFSTIIGIVTVILFYRQQHHNASLVSTVTNLTTMITTNRYKLGAGATRSGHIIFLLVTFKALTYVAIYLALHAKMISNRKFPIFKLVPIIIMYFFSAAISTNRFDLIVFGSSIIYAVGYMYYKKVNWLPRANKKLVFRFFVIFVCVLFAFRMYGYLTGKSASSSLYDNISIYIGSSIICLDSYVTGASGISPLYRPQLLKGIYNALGYFGIKIPSTFSLPHQYWSNGASNVYTSLLPFLVLFGVIGLIVAKFVFGLIYGHLWKKIKSGKHEMLAMCYGSFFNYLTMFSIAERMVSQLITLTTLVEIFAMVLSWRYLMHHKKERNINA
jgi:oligosaccharide repeat unit polymerase